jgi:hypothetical protein
MANNSETATGSYIVRDKRGAYMGAYSEKLGSTNAKIWATDCARQSRGILYYRETQEGEEREIQSFIELGKKTVSSE